MEQADSAMGKLELGAWFLAGLEKPETDLESPHPILSSHSSPVRGRVGDYHLLSPLPPPLSKPGCVLWARRAEFQECPAPSCLSSCHPYFLPDQPGAPGLALLSLMPLCP